MDKIEELLKKIDHAVDEANWSLVGDLSKEILSLDPMNPNGLAFLEMAKRKIDSQNTSFEEKQKEALPSAFVGKRYKVKELLGEGARKKVFLCRDTSMDRDIAFSLVKTEGLDEDARKRVIREAKVMAGSVPIPT